jgi:predicted nucleic acid-binding protein
MTNLFLDTDILVDLLSGREPFVHNAARLMNLVEKNEINAYASSLSFANLYYVSRRTNSHNHIIGKLNELSELIGILKVDEDAVRSALNSQFHDFEDALQYFCTTKYKRIDIIITRNVKDYRYSETPVMTPETFLKLFESGELKLK